MPQLQQPHSLPVISLAVPVDDSASNLYQKYVKNTYLCCKQKSRVEVVMDSKTYKTNKQTNKKD